MSLELFAGSDGRFYTGWQVGWRLESGRWRPCMWDTEAGWELVESDDGLVWLWPVSREDLPSWTGLRAVQPGHGVEVVDRRET